MSVLSASLGSLGRLDSLGRLGQLSCAGHCSHGAPTSVSGRSSRANSYGLTADGSLDYDGAHAPAREHRPGLIVCGAGSYPRTVDFPRFRAIADDVGVYLPAAGGTLANMIQRAVFPFLQGTPILSAIAARARALSEHLFELAPNVRASARAAVQDLCLRFPIPHAPPS